jgi:hypothetical protein
VPNPAAGTIAAIRLIKGANSLTQGNSASEKTLA